MKESLSHFPTPYKGQIKRQRNIKSSLLNNSVHDIRLENHEENHSYEQANFRKTLVYVSYCKIRVNYTFCHNIFPLIVHIGKHYCAISRVNFFYNTHVSIAICSPSCRVYCNCSNSRSFTNFIPSGLCIRIPGSSISSECAIIIRKYIRSS